MDMENLLNATGVVFCFITLAYFFSKLRHARLRIKEYQRRGLPVAPHHNFVFGHLLYIKSLVDALPKTAHYQYALAEIAREHFQKEGAYYLDLWPVSGLILVVANPNTGMQVTQTNSKLAMERPEFLRRFFAPIAGGSNLFDLDEREWKPWRAIFNKGFNTEHTLSLVPGMVKETRIYSQTLRKLVHEDKMFYLDNITLRFTMDLIGQTILNSHLGAQTGYNTLADCMLSQIRWLQPADGVNPLESLNIVRWLVHWWNGRQMNQYIGEELDKRYSEFKELELKDGPGKSVMDIVLQAYVSGDASVKPKKLEVDFRDFAIRQIRLFMFAGHDSTSSTICYCLHLLSTHPEALDRTRSEHDAVFGSDFSAAASILEEQPHTVSSLPYTTAVIKEALRLFPPASASRRGKSSESVTDDQGNVCPTVDSMVHLSHVEIQRNPKYWPRPEKFLPERWLVGPNDELYPAKGAWRPFENGPRNCPAQGLVMTELRVALACIVREFEFSPAYDEWDALYPHKGAKVYRGDRAYQMEGGAAHPVEHYPCRVRLRKSLRKS